MIGKIIGGFFKFIGWTILIVIMSISFASILLFWKFRPAIKENIRIARADVSDSTYESFLTTETSYVFGDNNRVLAKINVGQDAEYLLYENIPRDVVNAFVAVEDRNFWNHNGIDLKGITRVLYNYVKSDGGEAHGASTITQQVTRRTFLNFDATIERKIREIFYSFEVERRYSKEEIMEFYVNDIYYANQCYGISSAAKFYFNKPISELSLSQVAYLCAIPNSPAYYNPIKNKDNAIPRRNKILSDMFECNYITMEEYQNALNEEIVLDLEGSNIEFSNYQTTYATKCAVEYFMKLNDFYFRSNFRNEDDYKNYLMLYSKAYEKAYKQISSGGYKIYTSLNDEAQNTLQKAIDDELAFNKDITEEGLYDLQSAATLIDNSTHKVIAIVGGRTQNNLEEIIDIEENNNVEENKIEEIENNTDDIEDAENADQTKDKDTTKNNDNENIYSLNRAFQSFRQPGSSIKPLVVYTPALERGFTPDYSIIYDISTTAANAKDADIEKLTGKPYIFRKAVEQSKNGCAYYVYYRIGPKTGLEYIQNMGFKKIVPDDYYMPSGLGGLTYGVTTEEMASAYSTLANSGKYVKPTCIVSILNKDGEEIFEDYEEKEIYTESAANAMIDVLKGVITDGTARHSVKWEYDIDVAGKTGTTNEQKDGWFCGCSPYYTLAIWVGNDKPKTVENLQGGTYPAKIWSNAMNVIHKDLAEAHFNDYDLKELLKNNEDFIAIMPDRDGEEILSGTYTVNDYRFDRFTGKEATKYIEMLEGIVVIADNNDVSRGQMYFENANALINTITDVNYKQELSNRLYAASTNYMNLVNIYQTMLNNALNATLLQQMQQPQ